MRELSTCKSPRLVWTSPSTFHKFQVGQIVTIRLALSRNVPGGVYTVTKQLPENHGEFEYRIKSVDEVHERVARESELIKPVHARSSSSETLSRDRSLVGYTIDTHESEFSEATSVPCRKLESQPRRMSCRSDGVASTRFTGRPQMTSQLSHIETPSPVERICDSGY